MSGTVVIVGGGPAGLMLGCELRLGGIETIILEQRREAPAASGGMAVHGQTMKVLKERGFAERIHGEGIFPWPRTPFALLWLDISSAKPEELTYVYPQWRLERLLESRAVELGVDLRRGHRVIGVEQDAAGVTARVAAGDEVYQLTGDYLVGCDGPDSAVRKAAGITSAVLGNSYYGVWGDLELTPGTDYPFESGVYDRGIFGAMPLVTGGLRLMSIEFDETGPTEEPVTEQELFESMRRITGGAPTTGKISHLGRFGGPVSIADRYRDGRILLAGDAAHSFFISGTQGVNTGIQDVVNLGWKLAATLRGWAPADLLDTYELERHPVGLRMCQHAQATMGLLYPLDRIAYLRDIVNDLIGIDGVSKHLLDITTAVRYPFEDATQSGAGPDHPLLGWPVPDATLVIGDRVESVATTLHAGRGVLLDLSAGAADLTGIADWSGRVDLTVADPIPDVDAATLLIRPDGHVAHADADGTDAKGLREALARWFGTPAPAGAGTP